MTSGQECAEKKRKLKYLKAVEQHKCVICGSKTGKGIKCDICQIKNTIHQQNARLSRIESIMIRMMEAMEKK